ncbi:hypothetical protein HYFRA_00013139 [Hymenoscyphus fraxineus]|uniref:Uncharacterized protein n=1 Tax=Hymenoscyphus fraxineus TaxID=746836 RepID=A0A9N9L993_9HELO|nr:hypothetical protein HYFRA_00013139 [Hymenoscyphus fraxineus]
MTTLTLRQYSSLLQIPAHHLARHTPKQLSDAIHLQTQLSTIEDIIQQTQSDIATLLEYEEEEVISFPSPSDNEPLTNRSTIFAMQYLRDAEDDHLATSYKHEFLTSCFRFHAEEPEMGYDESLIAERWEMVREEVRECDEQASRELGEILGADMSLLDRHFEISRDVEDYVPLLGYEEDVLSHFSLDSLAQAYNRKLAVQEAEIEVEDSKRALTALQDPNKNAQQAHNPAETLALSRHLRAQSTLEALTHAYTRDLTPFHLVSSLLTLRSEATAQAKAAESAYRDALLENIAFLSPNGVLPWPPAVTDPLSLQELASILEARERLSEAEFVLQYETIPGGTEMVEVKEWVEERREGFWELTRGLWDRGVEVENERVEREGVRVGMW